MVGDCKVLSILHGGTAFGWYRGGNISGDIPVVLEHDELAVQTMDGCLEISRATGVLLRSLQMSTRAEEAAKGLAKHVLLKHDLLYYKDFPCREVSDEAARMHVEPLSIIYPSHLIDTRPYSMEFTE
jgi:hypothetical protein